MQIDSLEIKKILSKLNINAFNAMQKSVYKTAQNHSNIVLNAPTGSGKTLAYLMPLIQKIDPTLNQFVQALIICPTRELTLQIRDILQQMQLGLKIYSCYGGHSLQNELTNLQNPPDILIGTPGRLADHIRRASIDLSKTHSMILDEFDKSLELGFSKEMSFIIEQLEALENQFLISATSMDLLPDYLNTANLKQLQFGQEQSLSQLIIKANIGTQQDKNKRLLQLTTNLSKEPTLIFCNHRAVVENLGHSMQKKGFTCGIFHGGLEQSERELTLFKFKNGSINILVTTDLAARGIDISSIRHIVHYQLPHSEAEFIHRNGRTARMNNNGTAYLLLDEDKHWRDYLDDSIEYFDIPTISNTPFTPMWCTLYISAGKKDKISKFDIVGTLYKKTSLKKEEIGLIMLRDNNSYVCVKKDKADEVIKSLYKNKIKKKKIIVALAN